MRLLLCLVMLAIAASSSLAAAVPVSRDEARDWMRHVIPLPKQIAIGSAVRLPVADILVRTRAEANDVETHAAALLTGLLQSGSTQGRGELTLMLGVCDASGKVDGARVPGAEKLRGLPNCDQAYVIAPVGESRVYLTGLTDRAVYYAATTMRALLGAHLADGAVTVPIATVLDWPDLAERGEWGGNASADIPWMSAHKMNLVELHANLVVGQVGQVNDGRGYAEVNAKALEEGRLNALKVVPIIMHLDQIANSGIYTRFPELKGKGPSAQHKTYADEVAPCFSQPKMLDILTDWMTSLAAQKGVSDICVWLSEEPLQCGCDNCRKVGQYALEARSVVAAWRAALKTNPNVKLRILLTQGSYSTNDKVLAEVPPGVGVTYYDGGKTYDSSRDPMIYPLLEKYAASGRWLGVYPQLTASWRIVCPWSGPQFIKYRMQEFVDKKLSCLCGYATPSNRLYDFSVAAAAEWSWNAHGRDEREFSRAWATTRGLKDPEAAADWAVTLGPVGWDVYGSGIPYPWFFGTAADMIRSRAKPVLGKDLFRYFPTESVFARDLAACDKAMKLAEKVASPAMLAETQVIGGYLTMLQKLYEMASVISRQTPPTRMERESLNRDMHAFAEAGMQVATGLEAWDKACSAGGSSRLVDTSTVTEQTTTDVANAMKAFGIRTGAVTYFRRKVGGWQDDDFEKSESIQKRWDITGAVLGPGTYQATLSHDHGWNALVINRVAIATAPKDAHEKLTEVAVDGHQGFATYEGRDNTYTLELPTYDENLSYCLVADVTGVRSSDKVPERKGCNGTATFRKVMKAGEKVPELPLLPLSDEEQARLGGPKFTKGGLCVGVMQGGYGSESILAFLQAKTGLDAQPLYQVTADSVKPCQVIVLPQPRVASFLTPEAAKLLARWIQDGGGLIATHDAVGYRGLPSLAPEVCVKGTGKGSSDTWRPEGTHALTQGLTGDLPHSYYDYIVLQPGPTGTIAAQGAAGEPVVVCGEAGKGRYVACGLAIGLAQNDEDGPPSAGEGQLLENAVRWVGRP